MAKTIENVKTPLFAAVGAGDYAVAALADVVAEVRRRAEVAQTRVGNVRGRILTLQEEIPSDIASLRARLNTAELRKTAETYRQAATGVYSSLAERGEGRVEQLRKQPLIERRLGRAEAGVGEAVQAFSTVTRQVRAVGEKAALLTGRAAEQVADTANAGVAAAKEKAAEVVEAAPVAEIKEAAAEVVAEVKSSVADLADEARETLVEAADKVAEVAESAKESTIEVIDRVVEAAEETAKKAPARRRAPAKKPATATAARRTTRTVKAPANPEA